MNDSPANWNRRRPPAWSTFVEQLRAKLTPAEMTFFERAVAKLDNNCRERIQRLGLDDAIAELRREMRGASRPALTTREEP